MRPQPSHFLPLSLFSFFLALAALFTSAGCESVTPSRYPVASHASLGLSRLAPESVGGGGVAEDAATTELRQVFADWTRARGSGDVAALEALYDVGRFEGVRRARTGVEKRLTWAEWSGEQRFGIDHAKAPDHPLFETWPGGTLDAATASVTFTEGAQRRVLVFGRGSDGKLRVVREELGSSAGDAALPPAARNTLSRDAKVLRALGETADK
jgi:hypothetical protein